MLYFLDCKFSSAGREDADVRMLGEGRPCLLEVVNPRRVEFSDNDFRAWSEDIYAKAGKQVELLNIAIVDGEKAAAVLKNGEDGKSKSYSCIIYSKIPISTNDFLQNKFEEIGSEVTLSQRTPLRVVQRRANIVRTRKITNLHSAKLISPHFFQLQLTSEAGTYIKEFVHGDFGRTTPSLGSLLHDDNSACLLLELDVVNINMGEVSWPPLP